MRFLRMNRRGVIATIAQLLIIVFLFPIVLQLLALVIPISKADAGSFIIDILDAIPCFDSWVEILYEFLCDSPINGGTNLETILHSSEYFNSTFSILNIFFDALLAALCIKITQTVQDYLSFRGASVLSSFTGVLFSFVFKLIIKKFVGNDQNIIKLLIYYGGLIAIILVGFFVIFSTVLKSLKISKILFSAEIIVYGISAIITSGYLTMMILMVNGYVENYRIGFSYGLLTTAVEMLNLVSIWYYYFFKEKFNK